MDKVDLIYIVLSGNLIVHYFDYIILFHTDGEACLKKKESNAQQ